MEWKWEIISIDFIIGLPKNVKQHDSIMVVVDKLSKSNHFISVKSDFKFVNIADFKNPPCSSYNKNLINSFEN